MSDRAIDQAVRNSPLRRPTLADRIREILPPKAARKVLEKAQVWEIPETATVSKLGGGIRLQWIDADGKPARAELEVG